MSILLGYDDSDGSRRALEVAVDVASRLGEPLHIAFGAGPPGRAGEEFRAHADALEEIGRRLVEGACAAAREAGVEATSHVAAERPVDLLLRLGEELDARVIVVGSYGESPLRGAVLGSTPHKLLHLSDRPVLAVPATSRSSAG